MLIPKKKNQPKNNSSSSSNGGSTSEELSASALMQKRQEELWDEVDAFKPKAKESNWEVGRSFGDVTDANAEDEDEDDNKLTLNTSENESVSISKEGLELTTGDYGVGIGKDGITHTIAPFGEDGPSIELKKDAASISYEIPGSGFAFPPPKGKWEGPSLNMPIATPIPGLFINITGGLEGGIVVPELKMNLGVSEKPIGDHKDVSMVKIEFELANKDVITASFGGNVRIGVLGGVPMVAAIEAGVEAATEAKMEITPKISGQGEYILDSSGDLVTSRTNISASMGASAGLEASLALYLSGQLIVFKGDLFKLTLVSKDIASMKGGATMTRTWMNGGKGKNSIDPIYEKYFVTEGWFKDILTANKLDKATADYEYAQYDVFALEDLKRTIDFGYQDTHRGQVNNSKMRIATSKIQNATKSYFETVEKLKDTSLSLAKKGQLNKDIETYMNEISDANLEYSKAHSKFTKDNKNIKKVNKNLKNAKKVLAKAKKSNGKLMNKKLLQLDEEYGPKRDELVKKSYEALNTFDQYTKWLDTAPSSKKSFYKARLKEATNEKLKMANDLDELLREYGKKQNDIKALLKVQSRNPLAQESE